MTVKELKDKLEQMPENAEVVITVDWTSVITSVVLNEADNHFDHQYVELM